MQDYFIELLEWCKVKIRFWDKKINLVFKEGEVWWCSIGLNIGEESYGKGPFFARPVLIFKKFTANSFLGLPLTSKEKIGNWYIPSHVSARKGAVMLNQARILDRKRLMRRMAVMNDQEFQNVKRSFVEFYGPPNKIITPSSGEGGDRWEIPNS